VAPGRAHRPTVTIRCQFEDWADLAGGRRSGVQLAARGRIRLKGDLRWLWSARRMFPR
jgi:putative sterol carrier protein